MVKGIRSGEVLGSVSMRQADAPRHTDEGHLECAYYMEFDTTERIWLFNCPHGRIAKGAFYSEDLIRELRETFQYVDGLGAFDYTRAEDGTRAVVDPNREIVRARMDPENIGKAKMMLAGIREMLK